MNMNRMLSAAAILVGLLAFFGFLVAVCISNFILPNVGYEHPVRYLVYLGNLVESLGQSLAIVLVGVVAYRIALSK